MTSNLVIRFKELGPQVNRQDLDRPARELLHWLWLATLPVSRHNRAIRLWVRLFAVLPLDYRTRPTGHLDFCEVWN